jgi:DNA repair exonuclease SbcCD ATPase subunit
MLRIVLLSLITLTLFSCKQETPGTNNGGSMENMQELKNQIKQLELDNALKDSVINESLAFFNEIKSNLESISVKKDMIRAISEDPEISNDDKNWILEEIKHINFLREQNARKVKQLQEDLKKNGLKIEELEVMIESLLKDIQWKDEQIGLLQSELEALDREYSALFDAYQEQATTIDVLTEEVNRAYYAYGTEGELRDNKVVEKKNGFIGLGRSTELKDNFNDDYFTDIDVRKTKTITVSGEKIRLVTDHPKSSYELVESGALTKIKITDPSEFWKISKYLVVIVD